MDVDVVISYDCKLSDDIVSAFQADIKETGLKVIAEKRAGGPYAGMEWLLPTAIAAYLAKPYIEAFLQEAAKDHYQIVKTAFGNLITRLFGKKPQQRRVCVSSLFSIYSEAKNGIRIKFLFQEGISLKVYLESIEAIHKELKDHYERQVPDNLTKKLEAVKSVGKTVCMIYDEHSEEWKSVDLMKEVRKRKEEGKS